MKRSFWHLECVWYCTARLKVGSMIGVMLHGQCTATFSLIGQYHHVVADFILFGLFEKNAYRTVIKLVIASGLVTWVIGSLSSIHIGASGYALL